MGEEILFQFLLLIMDAKEKAKASIYRIQLDLEEFELRRITEIFKNLYNLS